MILRRLQEWPTADGPDPFMGRYGISDTHGSIDGWLLGRIIKGWSAAAIVAAADGRVSKRTVHRWRSEFVRLEQVRLGDHTATFAIRRSLPPVRMSSWVPSP